MNAPLPSLAAALALFLLLPLACGAPSSSGPDAATPGADDAGGAPGPDGGLDLSDAGEPWMLSNTSGGLVEPLAPDAGRSCFNRDNASKPLPTTDQAVIVVDEAEHLDGTGAPMYGSRRCTHYFPYYEGHVFFVDDAGVQQPVTAANCAQHADAIHLREGYAPFPVMFRGTRSQLKEGISRFHWALYGPLSGASGPLIKTSDAFNLAYIFETPGEYRADLTILGPTGRTSTASTTVTVWPRSKATFYVDSALGDDRATGRAATPQAGCDASTAPFGTCDGPWKTATRALAELGTPRTPSSWPDGKATARGTCTAPVPAQVALYNAGWFKTYRSQALIPSMVQALTQPDGGTLTFGPLDLTLCPDSALTPTRPTVLSAGDQILFRRGQTFDMDPGVYQVESYTADVTPDASTTACAPIAGSTQVRCSYERLTCKPTAGVSHWPQAIGILLGAYGDASAAKPLIQNVGDAACTFLELNGVGQFHLTIQDLAFDMASPRVPVLDNQGRPARSLFLYSPANGLDLTLNRVELSRFEQGVVLTGEHGVFIHRSRTYDSNVVHFYVGNGSDISLEDNTFDYAGNHLAYTGMREAVVSRNTFSRPAFGRTALRVDGAGGFANPNRYVWVSDNKFLGWVDPRTTSLCLAGRCPYADGKRYNFALVHFGPNTPDELANRDTIFTRNIVKDAETFLALGNNENLTIRDNYFSTLDSGGSTRVNLAPAMVFRPNRNVLLAGNTFLERAAPPWGQVVGISTFQTPAMPRCDDVPEHEGLRLVGNTFHLGGRMRALHSSAQRKVTDGGVSVVVDDLSLEQAEARVRDTVRVDGNRLYGDGGVPSFAVHGSALMAPGFSSGGTTFSDGTDPLGFPYRVYSLEGAALKLGVSRDTNAALPPAATLPDEPF